ncbi:hypothetical protein BKA70DRAFT_1220953 [Coprinopsis sp. MPI-PUGE-AT-0042]|nr:hypothetical protein BKA70DRAFT_1220953 [Coprinopsis sp. MPI-PUGE-AT-0042]
MSRPTTTTSGVPPDQHAQGAFDNQDQAIQRGRRLFRPPLISMAEREPLESCMYMVVSRRERRFTKASRSVLCSFPAVQANRMNHKVHSTATFNLEEQEWLPPIMAQAPVLGECRDPQRGSPDATRKAAIAKSLELWNERMDQSLHFLYNASHSRGLAHEVTKNLSFLVHSEKLRQKNTEQHYPVWDEKTGEATGGQKFTDNSLGALGELVQMAESRGHMSLGRVILKRWIRSEIALPEKVKPSLSIWSLSGAFETSARICPAGAWLYT